MAGQRLLRRVESVNVLEHEGAHAASLDCTRRFLLWMISGFILGFVIADAAHAEVAVLDSTAVYPEGPLWRRGALLFVEYSANDIKRWDGQSIKQYWKKAGCGPSGLIGFGKNHLLVACYDANSVVELDEHCSEVRTFAADRGGQPFHGPNDFAADRHGGVYFSASGAYDVAAASTGAVLHLSANGGDLREVASKIHYSNGLTLSKDGKTLLVAEMLAQRILAFPVLAGGSLGERHVWVSLQDLAPVSADQGAYNGPDGLKLGPDGNYYIAQNGSGRVLVVSESRKLLKTISVATPYVTNIAFGKDDARTLYVTGTFDEWNPPYAGAVYRVVQ